MNFSAIGTKASWRILLWSAAVALALVVMLRSDLQQLRWVSDLSMQGSPPPARDPHSPTGYVLGQRHFLGKYERGETYRWIAATQDLIASGPFAPATYVADTVPAGRPRLMPKLYAGWIATVAWSLHVITGEPLPLAVERAALWEPVISHALAFAAAGAFMWLRFGAAGGVAAALFFAFFPPLFGQFLPGMLTPRLWALLLSAYTIALSLPAAGRAVKKNLAFSVRSAVAGSFALWLDPAFGFPAVLLVAVSNAAVAFRRNKNPTFTALKWSLIGSSLTFVAWLIDQNPWAPAAGELRSVHPLYALAWLGLGLTLDGAQRFRTSKRPRRLPIAELAAATMLLSALVYTQLRDDFKGWLYPSVWMRRITSLDETSVFNTVADWLGKASAVEAMLILGPAALAAAMLAVGSVRNRTAKNAPSALLPATVVFAGLFVLALFRVRWGVVAALTSLPFIASVAAGDLVRYRRAVAIIASVFLVGLVAWNQALPAAFQRPSATTEATPTDLEALIYRHFSHWLAAHNPVQPVSALAPPELSDSIVFHGGGHVLMSTAWESYPGQVAAARILSALESTEAEAVLQSRAITHVILPSWDKVLPLFVQKPTEAGKDTLYERLQRWVFPAYLRPIPYQLPAMPAYVAEKLTVFKVTAPQDEALMLSRLAEYFVEMGRGEPASLAARVLAESYSDDPNSSIARATVYDYIKRPVDFKRELARLSADATAGRVPAGWDRRVQRAIVFALGGQRELARAEVKACLATASAAALLELTPLQAYRLMTLAKAYDFSFADGELARLAASLGSEYDHHGTKPTNE